MSSSTVYVLSAGVRGLIRAVHGVTMRSDGPYLFRRSLFSPRELVPDSFFLNFEFPIRAMQRRVRSSVVTIECVPRRAGQSKSAGWRTVYRVGRDLLDTQGLLAERYDGRPGSVYLIRPDQHVAARWRRFDAAAVRVALQRALSL